MCKVLTICFLTGDAKRISLSEVTLVSFDNSDPRPDVCGGFPGASSPKQA
jgi:hypothetical protein